jgi:cell division transport system permease protein
MSAIGYALGEALVTMRRSGRSAVMSMGTIAIAFLTLGGFLLLSANVQSIVERWASAAEMSVYLRDDLGAADREAIIDQLNADGAVASVEFVSKDDAVERFKSDFPELADVTASMEQPFPPALEVRLRTDADSTRAAASLAGQLATRAGVVDVRYDSQWLLRLMTVVTSVRVFGFIVAAVLVLGAAFTVSAVVRLSQQSRRDELDIMQLVGAPFSFIRGPSIAEGMLLGGIGAVVSLGLLWALFTSTRTQLTTMIASWGSIGELRFLAPGEALLLVGSGIVVGALSGLVASRLR